MLCNDIYEGACAVLDENGAFPDAAAFEARAPYMMSVIARELSDADAKIRTARELSAAPALPDGMSIPLSADFPLASGLETPSVYYLASLMAFSENPELSDSLFTRYAASLAEVLASLPVLPGSTSDIYGAL